MRLLPKRLYRLEEPIPFGFVCGLSVRHHEILEARKFFIQSRVFDGRREVRDELGV